MSPKITPSDHILTKIDRPANSLFINFISADFSGNINVPKSIFVRVIYFYFNIAMCAYKIVYKL